ncbi:Acetyltransferase (GNAT) family protein [Posidoniimonas corsicana]|uniref:Acetyltransferase (GNAT) family protein n=1 Tax=Posidoniimonas corsicana TaxID=1938618 RepID=A0A5C5VHS9_9BACT|nr:GNAT family N-acetyltransferase [Posidoniimonas corsicana]TWT37305.1 Acetyltransferase (GNAT) family protein [Posidoniimonas corsicana]
MSLARFAYRIGKAPLRRMPAWMLRVRPFTVYAIPTGHFAELADRPVAPPTETVRWATPDDTALLGEVAGHECAAQWDGVNRRAAIVTDDGQPIACVWVARQNYLDPDLDVDVRLYDGDRWLYAAVVAADRRREGVYSRLLRFVGQELHAEGAKRIVLGVTTGNHASVRAHAKWRPTPLGKATVLRVLGCVFCRCSGRVGRVSTSSGNSRNLITLQIER